MGAEFSWTNEQEAQLRGIEDGITGHVSSAKKQTRDHCPLELDAWSCHLRALVDRSKCIGAYLCTVMVTNPETGVENTLEVDCSGPDRAKAQLEADLPGTKVVPVPKTDTVELSTLDTEDAVPKRSKRKPPALPQMPSAGIAPVIKNRKAQFEAAKAARKRAEQEASHTAGDV